jgi:hypothetical protein
MAQKTDSFLDTTVPERVSKHDGAGSERRKRPTVIVDCSHIGRDGHAVHFYNDDDALLDLLSGYVGSALVKGGAAVVIGTVAHRAGLRAWLHRRCFDLDAAARQGRYLALDAGETLDRLLINGQPEPGRVRDVIGSALDQTRGQNGNHRDVAVFGEMVAVLWARRQRDATLRLEALWNALNEVYEFSLCCAYPMNGFSTDFDAAAFLRICSQHSHIFPADRRAVASV